MGPVLRVFKQCVSSLIASVLSKVEVSILQNSCCNEYRGNGSRPGGDGTRKSTASELHGFWQPPRFHALVWIQHIWPGAPQVVNSARPVPEKHSCQCRWCLTILQLDDQFVARAAASCCRRSVHACYIPIQSTAGEYLSELAKAAMLLPTGQLNQLGQPCHIAPSQCSPAQSSQSHCLAYPSSCPALPQASRYQPGSLLAAAVPLSRHQARHIALATPVSTSLLAAVILML